ncbi:MAG: isochorismatase [Deltaproteobacteria bacterium]|nr:MAG: isochorismatase [Deltaproteobacteria bacterium]
MARHELPIPEHFNPDKLGEVWKVPYQERAAGAYNWAKKHEIPPASRDSSRISLVLVDVQNTFCIPDFELYVGGRSGTGAVDDNRRVCEFIYRNLKVLTEISPTMDTHQAMQIFHTIFFVDENGEHPPPYTLITLEDIEQGVWKFNRELSPVLGVTEAYGQRYLRHYTRKLIEGGKYDLTIWPYHAMLGGIGHALVSAIEEAIFFHSIVRYSQPDFQIKGGNPFTENYSVLRPEVLEDAKGQQIAQKNVEFIDKLIHFDAVVIAGQAKSHCVAWTIDDLLSEIATSDKELAEKVYLLEDCSSPVVIPGVVDYTDQANAAFRRFADAGMHVVNSTDPIESWPDMRL